MTNREVESAGLNFSLTLFGFGEYGLGLYLKEVEGVKQLGPERFWACNLYTLFSFSFLG